MKNVFFFVVWLCVTGSSTLAKGPVWHQGKLYLVNGTVLEGRLSYNWKAEIVQIQQGDAVKAYSAFQVESFKYFDEAQNTIRTFVGFDYAVKPTLRRPLFLEECAKGPLMVYRRLRHIREPLKVVTPSAFGTDEGLFGDVDSFTYYVVDPTTNTVHNLDGFSRNLWPRLCNEFGDELRRYAGALQMDLTNTMARLLLIHQYNTLKIVAVQARQPDEPTFSTGH